MGVFIKHRPSGYICEVMEVTLSGYELMNVKTKRTATITTAQYNKFYNK